MDCAFQKLIRKMIRPPASVGWTCLWRKQYTFGTKTKKNNKNTALFANLDFWFMHCKCADQSVGPSRSVLVPTWTSLAYQNYCFSRCEQLGNWENVATQSEIWW